MLKPRPRHRCCAAALLFGGASLIAFAADAGRAPAMALDILLPGGVYHGDEVPYPQGPGWMALLDGDPAALVPVALDIRIRYDAVLDTLNGVHTGKHVSSVPATDALVLLRGELLRDGAVDAAEVAGDYQGLAPKTLKFRDRVYSLQLESGCAQEAGACNWVYSDGAKRQVLQAFGVIMHEGEASTEASSTGLIWAGDLDRDGLLDLIVDVADHYNAVAQVRVLLSSLARDDELVGVAGVFSAVGC